MLSHWNVEEVEHVTNTGITGRQRSAQVVQGGVPDPFSSATDSSVIPALSSSSSRYPQQAEAFAQEGLTATAITAGNIFCKISPTVAWGCVKRC